MIMANWSKKILGLAVVGSAVAGLVYYFKKKDSSVDDEFTEDFEDEDFDLDNDLKSVADREYVPLTPSAKEEDAKEDDCTEATSEAADSKASTSKDDTKEDTKEA